jgi:predicted RNA-binding protein with PIN domain
MVAATWVVDGMNLIGSRAGGWWRDPDRAVRSLIDELERYTEVTGETVILVFDYRPRGLTVGTRGGLKVRFADGKAQAADRLILELLREHPHPDTVRVVTSDKALREGTEAIGATVTGVGAFRERLEGS